MIKKYRFGKPFPTEAVVENIPEAQGAMPRFAVDKSAHTFTCPLAKEDRVYGLGEQVRGINKRGWHYVSYNEDNAVITEKRTSLYATHNFLVVAGEKGAFGAFFDSAARAEFDIGYTHLDELKITATDVDVYLIDGANIDDIVRQFRKIIGQSYIPPKWALGFGQSRWGYKCEEDIRAVAKGYRDANMPLDAIYVDIDYMERYKDFTVHPERYPDFKGLASDMRAEGIRLVPIIDAAVKVEDGYFVYEEGKAKGYFCKGADGEPYVVGVWPGESVLPDVLSPEARKWFGAHYKILLDEGIEGFWNDMNEPALFYSKGRLHAALEVAAEARGRNLVLEDFEKVTGAMGTLANNVNDYKEFYHETPVGRVCHADVHNLYGYNMTRAAAEFFEKYEPDKRFLLFSRSSCIGMHRYGGIWTGDNSSWWSHLLLNLKMLPSLNMCGFLFVGADLGGFGDDTTEDLLLRWLALGIFTPLMRNHTTLGTRNQECYAFGQKDAFRRILGIRYSLIPYLYSELVKCAVRGDMMFRPLAFEYPSDKRAALEDQILVGESLMICPVYEQNAAGRYVYLPEDMKLIRMRAGDDFTEEVLPAGDHYIEVALDEVVFFLRKGHVLPLAKPAKNTDELDEKALQFVKYIDRDTEYELYIGKGEKKSELAGAFKKVTVKA